MLKRYWRKMMTKIDKKWFRMQEIDSWIAFIAYNEHVRVINRDSLWKKAELGGTWQTYDKICKKFNIPEGRYWEND